MYKMKCRTLLAAMAAVLLMTSCIDEDLSECGRTELLFSYVGDGTSEIFPEKICNVDLYVFDEDNRVVATQELGEASLRARQGTALDLNPGRYRIVCVGNAFEATVIGPSADAAEAHFSHHGAIDGAVIDGTDSLYWGSAEVNVPQNRELVETIPFRSSHVDVVFEVEGAENTAGGLSLSVENLYASVGLYDNVARGGLYTYRPGWDFDDGSHLVSAFNVARISDGQPVSFVLTDGMGAEVERIDLGDFLAEHDEVDITRQEACVPIRVVFDGLGVRVDVPDWYVEELKPEF